MLVSMCCWPCAGVHVCLLFSSQLGNAGVHVSIVFDGGRSDHDGIHVLVTMCW